MLAATHLRTTLRLAMFAVAMFAHPDPASAAGAADGERGLTALQNGDYRTAVQLFTRALDDRTLIRSDRALAHLSRGKAYIGLQESKQAEDDFREAIRLEPGDTEAATALRDALSQEMAGLASAQPKPPARRGDPWGMLANVAGRYYWYEVPGDDPNAAYAHFEWTSDHTGLIENLRSLRGQLLVGRFQVEPGSGKLIGALVVSGRAIYETLDADAKSLTEYSFDKATPVKTVSTLQADGSMDVDGAEFQSGRWRDYRHFRLVEVSLDELTTKGLIKSK